MPRSGANTFPLMSFPSLQMVPYTFFIILVEVVKLFHDNIFRYFKINLNYRMCDFHHPNCASLCKTTTGSQFSIFITQDGELSSSPRFIVQDPIFSPNSSYPNPFIDSDMIPS